jgi:WD40 repeat protein
LQNEAGFTNQDAFNQAEAINWHPDSAYLFLIYHNMRVEWWIPEYDQHKELEIQANMIVCSPCGNLLLASDYGGTVKVYSVPKYSKGDSFGQVTLLYSLKCSESIVVFAFSPNGQRFYEVRGTMRSVWAPVELVPADKADAGEDRLVRSEELRDSGSDGAMITAIARAPGDEAFCYGKDDGSLTIQDMDSGKIIRSLTGHSQDVTIIALTWSTSGNWIASADDSGQIRKIRLSPRGSSKKNKFFKPSSLRLSDGINQLLFSPDDSYLLISTSSTNHIWDTSAKRTCKTGLREASAQEKWIVHAKDPSRLVSVGAEVAHVSTWDEFATPAAGTTQDTQSSLGSGTAVEYVTQKRDLRALIFETLLNTGYDDDRSTLGSPMVQLLQHVSKVVGRLRNKVVFFNKTHWLCTWEIGAEVYHMHLLLPNDWINPETLELSVLCACEALLCPWKGEVAIIRNWTQPHSARVVAFM